MLFRSLSKFPGSYLVQDMLLRAQTECSSFFLFLLCFVGRDAQVLFARWSVGWTAERDAQVLTKAYQWETSRKIDQSIIDLNFATFLHIFYIEKYQQFAYFDMFLVFVQKNGKM